MGAGFKRDALLKREEERMSESIFPKTHLGFGLMRLPKQDNVIIHEEVCRLAEEFMAQGFTYFDTAYVYAGSEEAFREAVVKRHPRESFTVADKMAGWVMKGKLTPEAMFEESLRRCGVTYFDYYLLHSLTGARKADYEKHDCWTFVKRMKEQGKIRHLGFSFHGEPELLQEILEQHPEVEFVQLQINYVDWDSNSIWSGKNYEICRRFGKEIVVMEPIKGGFLANLPESAEVKLRAVRPGDSAASWALRYAASLPGVAMVLSGMSEAGQMEDNLATFKSFTPITDEEKILLREVADQLLSVPTIQCTACRYCCKGCPKAINIPEIFKAVNMLVTFGEHIRPHLYYDNLRQLGSARARDCIACGQCEGVCPQHLPIIELLKDASKRLDK